jgi:hypothetical protein
MRSILLALALALSALLTVPAQAVTLTKRSESTPWPGVTVRQYRTASPATDAWVGIVDLCTANIHVDATQTPTATRTTGTWAQAVGASLATNGDFYKTGPLRVYGDAVGNGVPWPTVQTGLDPRYAGEWYWENAGWIGFGHDVVTYNHTGWVKRNPGGRSLGGWAPTQVVKTRPPGILGIVSGFPELVSEGIQATCPSPTDPNCFPDRGDMRARHPRTAMGLTQDLSKLILLVVDGRTSSNSGMYGTELAETMAKLGAWQAFNLDGGGSSQFWQKGSGYRNNYNGNNLGNGARAIVNHWGVWAGSGNGKPSRPGSCVSSPPCQVIPATGGTVDNGSACFRTFGPEAYWRKVTTAGLGGSLYWTNAGDGARPSNWAWWQLHFETAGEYRVEFHAVQPYSKFDRVSYEVVADGTARKVTASQAGANGWVNLGTYRFARGGGQYVRVDDNAAAPVGSGQSIVADAIRLVPVNVPGCGNGACEASESCGSCPADCGLCPRCGDGTCNGTESCSDCPADCGNCCGNGTCNEGESCSTCSPDCGDCPRCGDGDCNGTESCGDCATDCGYCCGDGTCDTGETCTGCPADCGACTSCGDGTCNGDELCGSCPGDCGDCSSCGDGTCSGDEDCEGCPADCGACTSCGDGTCNGSERCSSCPEDCGDCNGGEIDGGGNGDTGPIPMESEGCACGSGVTLLPALGLLTLRRRRRG